MPTADRTTVKAAIQELVNKLRTNLIADPLTATQPLRRVEVGGLGAEEYPRPFLSVLLTRTRPIGTSDNDKLIEVSSRMRLVTDVTGTDPHDTILDQLGAVEDYLDGIADTGVLEGAEGFDDRTWTIEYPSTTSGARLAVAEAKQTFVIRVERGQNREPAA